MNPKHVTAVGSGVLASGDSVANRRDSAVMAGAKSGASDSQTISHAVGTDSNMLTVHLSTTAGEQGTSASSVRAKQALSARAKIYVPGAF